jgi:hypothetical protein
MVNTRESRASAKEKKFVVDAATGDKVREWARTFLNADPYGSGPFDDEYHTSSLYFDNAALDVFHRRGSFGRAKYRIRRYSGADYAFIERKMRRPNLLVKRRTQVGLEIISALQRNELPKESPAQWFRERVIVRRLVPACLVSYHRTARAISTANGLARLTVDDDIHAMPAADFSLLDAMADGETILPGQLIIELKYRGELPRIFQRLVRAFQLEGQTASKYRLAMMSLGHELAESDAREPAEVNVVRK